MAKKISELPAATLPLGGTELVEIVQGGVSKKVARSDLAPSSGAASWGSITGTLASQTDLVAALDNKVDKVAGKGLSEEDFTTVLRTKLINIQDDHFRGTFTSFSAMASGVTSPVAGDYADVDSGAGADVVRYVWDVSDAEWKAGTGGGGPASTDALPEGLSNLYFTQARVRSTVLTGLSLATATVISAADTMLSALGKLQAQISALVTGKQDTLVSGTNIKSINGTSLLGSGDLTISGGSGMANPMTTAGDIIVGGESGAPARLAKGTDGQMLLMASGAQAYGNNPTLAGYKEIVETMASNAIDVSTSNVKKRVLTANATFTISGASSGFAHTLILHIEGGNTYSVAWPASFKWLVPIPTLTAKHVISGYTIDGGTTWLINYAASYV